MSSVKSSPIPSTKCPSCGLVSDTACGEHKVKPGTLLVCWGCGQAMQLNIDWTIVPLSDDEVAKIPELLIWQEALRERIRGRG